MMRCAQMIGEETHTTSVRLSKEMYRQIKSYADKEGISINLAMRILLDFGLNVAQSDKFE